MKFYEIASGGFTSRDNASIGVQMYSTRQAMMTAGDIEAMAGRPNLLPFRNLDAVGVGGYTGAVTKSYNKITLDAKEINGTILNIDCFGYSIQDKSYIGGSTKNKTMIYSYYVTNNTNLPVLVGTHTYNDASRVVPVQPGQTARRYMVRKDGYQLILFSKMFVVGDAATVTGTLDSHDFKVEEAKPGEVEEPTEYKPCIADLADYPSEFPKVRNLQFVQDGAVTITCEGQLLIDKLHNTRAVIRMYTEDKADLDSFIKNCLSSQDDTVKVVIKRGDRFIYGGFLDSEGLEYYDTDKKGYILELVFGDLNPLKRKKALEFGKFVSDTDVSSVLYRLRNEVGDDDYNNYLVPTIFAQYLEHFKFEKRIVSDDISLYDLCEIVAEAMVGSIRQYGSYFVLMQAPISLYTRTNAGLYDEQNPIIVISETKDAIYNISYKTSRAYNKFVYKLKGLAPFDHTIAGDYVTGVHLSHKPKCGTVAPVSSDEDRRANWGSRYPQKPSNYGRGGYAYYERGNGEKSGRYYTYDGALQTVVTPQLMAQYIVGEVHLPEVTDGYKLEIISPYGSDVRYTGLAIRGDIHSKWEPGILIGNGADLLKFGGVGAGVIATFDTKSYEGSGIVISIDGGTVAIADDVQDIIDAYIKAVSDVSADSSNGRLLMEVQCYAEIAGVSDAYWLSEIDDTNGYRLTWTKGTTAVALWMEMGELYGSKFSTELSVPTPPDDANKIVFRLTGKWVAGYDTQLSTEAKSLITQVDMPKRYSEIAHNYGIMRYISGIRIQQGEVTTYRDRQAVLDLADANTATFSEALDWETRIGTSSGTGAYMFDANGNTLKTLIPSEISKDTNFATIASHEAFTLYSLAYMYDRRYTEVEFEKTNCNSGGGVGDYFKFLDGKTYYTTYREVDLASGRGRLRGRQLPDVIDDVALMTKCKEAADAMADGVFLSSNSTIDTGANTVDGNYSRSTGNTGRTR